MTLIMALTSESWSKYLIKRFSKEFWKNFIEGFELILCYFEWCRKPTFWKPGDKNEKTNAHRSIKIMMWQLNKLLPRDTGCGWDITKVHELLHIVDDIERYGALANTNTSPQENNHIKNNKRPATTALKQHAIFDWQLANWYTDHRIIDFLKMRLSTFKIDTMEYSFDSLDDDL